MTTETNPLLLRIKAARASVAPRYQIGPRTDERAVAWARSFADAVGADRLAASLPRVDAIRGDPDADESESALGDGVFTFHWCVGGRVLFVHVLCDGVVGHAVGPNAPRGTPFLDVQTPDGIRLAWGWLQGIPAAAASRLRLTGDERGRRRSVKLPLACPPGLDRLLSTLRGIGLAVREARPRVGGGRFRTWSVGGRGLRGGIEAADDGIYTGFDDAWLWDKMGSCPVRLVTRDAPEAEVFAQIATLPARLGRLCTEEGRAASKRFERW